MAPTTQQQQPQQHHAALSATALADRNRAVVARLLDLTFPTAAELRTIASYWSSISADERAALVATPFSPIRTALKDAIKQRCSCSNCKWSHISFLSRNADAALESRFHELREELCRCAGCASERLPSSASPSPSSSPYSSAPSSPRGSTATTSPASRATHVHGECVAHLSLFDAVLVLRDSRSLQTQYPPIVLPKATPPGGVVSILPHAARSASLVARLARLTSQLATAKEQLDECDACAAWLSLEFYWARHALQQVRSSSSSLSTLHRIRRRIGALSCCVWARVGLGLGGARGSAIVCPRRDREAGRRDTEREADFHFRYFFSPISLGL